MSAATYPLSGIRVVDLTTAWSGPLATRILGHLGAEVVKVESASRLDVWRHYGHVINWKRYPDGDAGARQYNRVSLFNSQNSDKLSVLIDFKRPGGVETVLKLVAISDVVISNFTPGALARLGLGYEALRAARPDIVVVEMPGFGNTGPMARYGALGPTMEMATGMAAMVGYPGGPPTTTGPSYPDPIGGIHGAAAVMTALAYRAETGRGQYVEVPQCEALMHFVGEYLLHALDTGEDHAPDGNRVPWAAPHDAFPALGKDNWVTIGVTTDAEWQQLCRTIGRPDLAADGRFATLPERMRHQDLLYEPIASWTRVRDKHESAHLLQAAGVPAAPVEDASDLVGSPYLAARDYFVELDHPEAGRHRYSGLPFHFSETPTRCRTASPCFGQHTYQVLRDILHLPEEEIETLERAGTIRSVPD